MRRGEAGGDFRPKIEASEAYKKGPIDAGEPDTN